MANGITYRVRPFMEPLNIPTIRCFISAGSAQLFVGPASSLVFEQMNVRSSTRATSLGCDLARKHPGRFCGLSRVSVPIRTMRSQRLPYSSSEPSHQKTWSGAQSFVCFSTQAISCLCVVLQVPKGLLSIVFHFPSRFVCRSAFHPKVVGMDSRILRSGENMPQPRSFAPKNSTQERPDATETAPDCKQAGARLCPPRTSRSTVRKGEGHG